VITDDDLLLNIVLTPIDNPHEVQGTSQVVVIDTAAVINEDIENSRDILTQIEVLSESGEITITEENATYFLVTSLSDILSVETNNPNVIITNLGNNVYKVAGAEKIMRTRSEQNNENYLDQSNVVTAFGTIDNFLTKVSRLAVEYTPGNGKPNLRMAGQARGESILGHELITYEESMAFAKKANEGIPGKVLTYVNRNGYDIFRGYKSGKLGLDRYEKRFQNALSYRGTRRQSKEYETVSTANKNISFCDADLDPQALAKKQAEMKTAYQHDYSDKEEKAPLRSLKKLRAGDEVYAHIDRMNVVKNKVNKFERRALAPLEENKSRLQGKNQQTVMFRVGGKSFSMDKYLKNAEIPPIE
ncbi:MAG: hypothetical protein OEL89_02810, partial [Candidatus Peregrinibacteria bacterium]|nr:hypothetical protein [Candidatus Peregrinibacteria bacterium]